MCKEFGPWLCVITVIREFETGGSGFKSSFLFTKTQASGAYLCGGPL